MAIALDTTGGDAVTTGTSLTYSHTCTGSNLILLVDVWVTSTGSDVVTGVTYNSVSMTLVDKQAVGSQYHYAYYLLGPATGAHNVVVSTSSSQTIGSSSISYTGVKQSGQPDASAKQVVGSSTGSTTTLTTIADNCWTVLLTASNRNETASTGSTFRKGGVTINAYIFDSNGAKTPAGSTSMSTTHATGASCGYIMVSIAPTASYTIAATTATFTLTGNDSLMPIARMLQVAVGSFSLTGIDSIMSRIVSLATSVGSFVLSGIDTIISYVPYMWQADAKNTTNWSGDTKNTTSWSGESKNSTAYSADTKSSTSWSAETKNTTNWS